MTNKSIKSYYTQVPESIPDVKSILVDKELEEYRQNLQQLTESEEKKFLRRNHVIDHLLSRFGESFNSNLLQKLIQSSNDHLSEGEIQRIALDKKIDFAEEIVNLGKNRIKGFNFSLPTWDHQNISGLEMRLKLMFGIQNKNIRSLVAPIVDNYQKKSGKEKWSAREVQIIKGPKTKLLSKSGDYSPDEVSIYCPDSSFFKSLFILLPVRRVIVLFH